LLGTIRLLFILYILESTFLSLSTSKPDTANPTKKMIKIEFPDVYMQMSG